MYGSRVDAYNIVDATPGKRDVIGELTEACHWRGLKFGHYYSQELDVHEPHGGGWIGFRQMTPVVGEWANLVVVSAGGSHPKELGRAETGVNT